VSTWEENPYKVLIKLGHPWFSIVVEDKNRLDHDGGVSGG
jgi:hypothetical protein